MLPRRDARRAHSAGAEAREDARGPGVPADAEQDKIAAELRQFDFNSVRADYNYKGAAAHARRQREARCWLRNWPLMCVCSHAN